MMHHYLSLLHEIPVYAYLIFIAICIVLWAILSAAFVDKKVWVSINRSIVVVAVVSVFFVTLFTRNAQQTQQIVLIPFAVLEQARIYPDVYNQMILNVVLFLPLGLSLPFCFTERIKHPVLMTICLGLVLSITVEVLQYILQCGYSELDDVILNTIGTACGTVSYFLTRFVVNMRHKGRINVG